MKVAQPLFPHQETLLEKIRAVLASGRLMNGEFSRTFEDRFAQLCRARYALSVNSCTTALEIVLRYIGVSGGEVIVPTNTFVATANAVLFAGGRPVFADIGERCYSLDPTEIKRLISPRTRAVVVVHIAGLVQPGIEEIGTICRDGGVPLIEDCAHAAGAAFKDRMAGTFGLAGCFSFYPTKIMTTGTGGMIVTDSDGLADYTRSVRVHGAGSGLSDVVHLGNDWFMDEIHACLGLNQLDGLDDFLNKRAAVAATYDRLLAEIEGVDKFPVAEPCRHAYYKYPVQITGDLPVDELKSHFLREWGFELESLYWPTCHLQPVYRKLFGYRGGEFPRAEATLARQVTLPLHAGLGPQDAAYVVERLAERLRKG